VPFLAYQNRSYSSYLRTKYRPNFHQTCWEGVQLSLWWVLSYFNIIFIHYIKCFRRNSARMLAMWSRFLQYFTYLSCLPLRTSGDGGLSLRTSELWQNMDFRHVKLTYRKRNVQLFIDRGVMCGQREVSVVNGNIANARLQGLLQEACRLLFETKWNLNDMWSLTNFGVVMRLFSD